MFGQEVREFESIIGRALGMGETELEASQPIIDYYNPAGLGGTEYFIYKGIKIYPVGQIAKIKAEESVQLGQRLHGAKEGKVVGRTT